MKSRKQVNFKYYLLYYDGKIKRISVISKISYNRNGLFQAPVYSSDRIDPILNSSTISACNNYECNIIAQSHALPITKKMRSSMF